VYGPALESGVDEKSGWTAGSIIDDAPNYVNGVLWPKNWYSGYKGRVTLRKSVEQSINVAAVKVINSIGFNKSVAFMKGLGITSITKDDYYSAALGLGGMTKGISPIEMTAAYGAFPNGGLYIAPTCYTKVLDADGNVILEKVPKTNQAMNKGVAFIMTDILRTSVSSGIAKGAAISGQPSAGKTGTTTNNYDAWFVGFTPQYSAALWIGNDVNVQLDKGSPAAAALWGNIMGRICNSLPRGNYDKPDNVEYRNGEYYVVGTYGTGKQSSSGTSEKQQTEVTASGSGITSSAVTSGEGIGTGDGITNAGGGTGNGNVVISSPDGVVVSP
jgi:penicillin-binding protein 1A